MLLRLSGNAKEVDIIFSDYINLLRQRRDKYIIEPYLRYHLSFGDDSSLKELGSGWLKQDPATTLSFFDRHLLH